MFFGAVVGLLITRSVWGAVIGAIIGQMFDQGMSMHSASASASISEVFFRSTFELMGHVAKSDGRVSESEIDAARRLMQELRLGPNEINAAMAYFRAGKSAAYDPNLAVEQLREACGLRHDLLRAFMELQLRAALAGNDLSPPARGILRIAAERLGLSAFEFDWMEAALRAQAHRRGPAEAGHAASSAATLGGYYAELEVDPKISDQEIVKAYRRQMSRHHPDKLVANGLPESMAQMAKEKTQRIQEAYEGIRAARGMQ
jgi:DnaJ like chaperone protein